MKAAKRRRTAAGGSSPSQSPSKSKSKSKSGSKSQPKPRAKAGASESPSAALRREFIAFMEQRQQERLQQILAEFAANNRKRGNEADAAAMVSVGETECRMHFGETRWLALSKQLINSMMRQRRLKLLQNEDGQLRFKLLDEELAKRVAALSPDEYKIYAAIEESGNRGVWIRDLRRKVQRSTQVIQKKCNLMKQRRLIKSIKSIQSKNRKVFMLYDLTPSVEVAGRCFHMGHEVDTEFLNVMKTLIRNALREAPMDAAQLCERLNARKDVFVIKIPVDDVSVVLESMWFEGTIVEAKQEYVKRGINVRPSVRNYYPASDEQAAIGINGTSSTTSGAASSSSSSTTTTTIGRKRRHVHIEMEHDNDSGNDDNHNYDGNPFESGVTVGPDGQPVLDAWWHKDRERRIYKLNNLDMTSVALCNSTRVPCTACPISHKCRPGGEVSPESCEYMHIWLKNNM